MIKMNINLLVMNYMIRKWTVKSPFLIIFKQKNNRHNAISIQNLCLLKESERFPIFLSKIF